MKILYFALFRERLNRSEEDLEVPAGIVTVSDLVAWLRSRDPAADSVFENRTLIRAALDAELVPLDTPLGDARVVALLPPMTGG